MEAEYIAAYEAASEYTDRIRKFITDLAMVPSITDPIELYCDNNGAIFESKEPSISSPKPEITSSVHLPASLNVASLKGLT